MNKIDFSKCSYEELRKILHSKIFHKLDSDQQNELIVLITEYWYEHDSLSVFKED